MPSVASALSPHPWFHRPRLVRDHVAVPVTNDRGVSRHEENLQRHVVVEAGKNFASRERLSKMNCEFVHNNKRIRTQIDIEPAPPHLRWQMWPKSQRQVRHCGSRTNCGHWSTLRSPVRIAVDHQTSRVSPYSCVSLHVLARNRPCSGVTLRA
jgi:hypothetical protein